MTTLREHLEAIVRGRFEADDAHPWADDALTPAEYRKHALMALAILDAAPVYEGMQPMFSGPWLVVSDNPDPESQP